MESYSAVIAAEAAVVAVFGFVEDGSRDSVMSLPLFRRVPKELLPSTVLRDCEELIPCAATLTDLSDSGVCRISVRSLGFA